MNNSTAALDRFKAFLVKHHCRRSLKLLDSYHKDFFKIEDLENLIEDFMEHPEETLEKTNKALFTRLL